MDSTVARHFRLGWWGLLVFLTLGIVLETLHGFKVRWYLDVANETRRLMWTLAHTHGTLVAVLNLLFATFLRYLAAWPGRGLRLASRCLGGALVLLPAGFLLGGLNIHGGDPGLGVVLVPPGALLLWIAVFCTAHAASRHRGE